jgi:surface antigen
MFEPPGDRSFAPIAASPWGLENGTFGGGAARAVEPNQGEGTAMIPRFKGRILAVALVGATLAACSSNSGPKEVGGTLVGAGAGALIGNAIGGAAGNRALGTVTGAALGGMLGNRIGAAMDDEDKRRAYAAQVQALESGSSGAPVAWRNPDSGRYGSIVPGPAYDSNGLNCRQFTHTIYIDGKPQTARGTACRNPDGTWCDRWR